MKAKANKASWEGLNAGVTREFIGKTAAGDQGRVK